MLSQNNNLEFVDYDPVTEKVIVVFGDLTTGVRREELTIWAYKSIAENPNDPSYTDRTKKIVKSIEGRGGMDWLKKQIEAHIRKQILNPED